MTKKYMLFLTTLIILLAGCKKQEEILSIIDSRPPSTITAKISEVKTEKKHLTFVVETTDPKESIEEQIITITDEDSKIVFEQKLNDEDTERITFDDLGPEQTYMIQVIADYEDQQNKVLATHTFTTEAWIDGLYGEIFDVEFSGNSVIADFNTNIDRTSGLILFELHKDGKILEDIESIMINSNEGAKSYSDRTVSELVNGENYSLVLNYIDLTTAEIYTLDTYDFTMEVVDK